MPDGRPARPLRAGQQPRARLQPPGSGRDLGGAQRGGHRHVRRRPRPAPRAGAGAGARRRRRRRAGGRAGHRLERGPSVVGCDAEQPGRAPAARPVGRGGRRRDRRAARDPPAKRAGHRVDSLGAATGATRSPAEQVRFAHRLIDGGFDLVHGHSSHHPRPIELYRGRLVLYGCGDFIDDYEGIGGYRAVPTRPAA